MSETLRQLFISGDNERHLRDNRAHFHAHERIVDGGIAKEFDAHDFIRSFRDQERDTV